MTDIIAQDLTKNPPIHIKIDLKKDKVEDVIKTIAKQLEIKDAYVKLWSPEDRK